LKSSNIFLTNNEISITQIAFDCGFTSVQFFHVYLNSILIYRQNSLETNYKKARIVKLIARLVKQQKKPIVIFGMTLIQFSIII
jgi:transcriptional regulator GlxA family with amidase domain